MASATILCSSATSSVIAACSGTRSTSTGNRYSSSLPWWVCSIEMPKSTWSARNVTRAADGVGVARTSRADSSNALRNVLWMIAMSRTSIGCVADICIPPLGAP